MSGTFNLEALYDHVVQMKDMLEVMMQPVEKTEPEDLADQVKRLASIVERLERERSISEYDVPRDMDYGDDRDSKFLEDIALRGDVSRDDNKKMYPVRTYHGKCPQARLRGQD